MHKDSFLENISSIITNIGLSIFILLIILPLQAINRIGIRKIRVHRVKSLMSRHLPEQVVEGAEFFHKKFIASENFYHQNSTADVRQKVFDINQKPLYEVVVVQEEINGKQKMRMIAIDQYDRMYFYRKLKADRKNTPDDVANARQRKIAIYDIHNNMISIQGKNGFEKGELEKNPTFQELLANAKMLNGEINSTPEELQHIKNKAEVVGKPVVHQLYNDHMLKLRPTHQACATHKEINMILA